MALKIGGGRKPVAPPVEEEQLPMEEAPVEEPAPDLMSELPPSLEEEPMDSGGDVSPEQVFYKTGQQRMAEACGNCKHYIPEGSCEIVAGEIDPEGICNIYSSAVDEADMAMPMEEEAEVPMEEPMAEEVPQEGY